MLVAFLPVINHLLRREPWARARLTPFIGRTITINLPPLGSITIVIAADGYLARAADPVQAEQVDLTVTVPAGALTDALNHRDALVAAMHVSGPVELANAVQFVARHLRWDAEDDLARVLGDIPARRLMQAGERLMAWQRDARARLGANVAEYVVEEAAIAARADDVRALARAITALDEQLNALEQRADRVIDRGVDYLPRH